CSVNCANGWWRSERPRQGGADPRGAGEAADQDLREPAGRPPSSDHPSGPRGGRDQGGRDPGADRAGEDVPAPLRAVWRGGARGVRPDRPPPLLPRPGGGGHLLPGRDGPDVSRDPPAPYEGAEPMTEAPTY